MACLTKEKVKYQLSKITEVFGFVYNHSSLLAVLYMEPDWDFLDLLNAASQRLELVPVAERIFNADGQYYCLLSTSPI